MLLSSSVRALEEGRKQGSQGATLVVQTSYSSQSREAQWGENDKPWQN